MPVFPWADLKPPILDPDTDSCCYQFPGLELVRVSDAVQTHQYKRLEAKSFVSHLSGKAPRFERRAFLSALVGFISNVLTSPHIVRPRQVKIQSFQA